MSLLQFVCGSGRHLLFLLRYSESLSPHDCRSTQAAGQIYFCLCLLEYLGYIRQMKLSTNLSSVIALSQVFLEYGFHPRVQRWVIGQCLCTEPRSLASYGVQRDGDTAYLYLVSARHARLTRQLFQQDQEGAQLTPAPSNGPLSQDWRGYSTLPSRLSHNTQGKFTSWHALTHMRTHD